MAAGSNDSPAMPLCANLKDSDVSLSVVCSWLETGLAPGDGKGFSKGPIVFGDESLDTGAVAASARSSSEIWISTLYLASRSGSWTDNPVIFAIWSFSRAERRTSLSYSSIAYLLCARRHRFKSGGEVDLLRIRRRTRHS